MTPSVQTRRQLVRGRVGFTTFDQADHERVLARLERAKSGKEHLQGRFGGENRLFALGDWSYSTVDREHSRVNYSVELTEVEDVQAERLTLDDIEVIPYQYEEKAEQGGAIVIDCRVVVEAEVSARLEELMRQSRGKPPAYFAVVRHGVEDASRSMRFGRCTWSRDGELVKHSLVLVEDIWDSQAHESNPFQTLFEIPTGNLVEQSALTAQTPSALLHELVAVGTLSTETAERLRQPAETDIWRRKRDLYQQWDIDAE